MVKMSSFNPLLLPENLNKYGLGIWTASLDHDVQETKQARAPAERHSKIFTIFCNFSRMTKFTFKNMEPLESDNQLIKIASSVAKIFVITMALVLTAINLWTTVPLITLLSLGIIADTLGLVKIFMEKGPKLAW